MFFFPAGPEEEFVEGRCEFTPLLCLEKSKLFGYVFFKDQLMWWLVMTSEPGYIEFIRSTQDSDGLFWDGVDFLERYCLNLLRTSARVSVQIPHPSKHDAFIVLRRPLATHLSQVFVCQRHLIPFLCHVLFVLLAFEEKTQKHFEDAYLAMFEPKNFGFYAIYIYVRELLI